MAAQAFDQQGFAEGLRELSGKFVRALRQNLPDPGKAVGFTGF